MRGSVAKKLRKVARARTVGLPQRGYTNNGTGGAMNVVATERGLYRMFKKQWRKGLIQL